MDNIGREAIAAHEAELKAYAHEQLGRINSLRIIGDAPGKGAIVSFEMEGIHAHDVSMLIDRSGVAVRAGTHCAQPLLTRFGVTSTCRASFAMYNTKAEIDVLAEALEKARSFSAERTGKWTNSTSRKNRTETQAQPANDDAVATTGLPREELARHDRRYRLRA